jgi:transcriptional regulator with XRE-family HTH domain
MDLRPQFAENLKRLRKARGISQEQLANDAGIDRAYMSRIEREVTYVGLEIIGKLADVLQVEPVDFFMPSPKEGRRSTQRPTRIGSTGR